MYPKIVLPFMCNYLCTLNISTSNTEDGDPCRTVTITAKCNISQIVVNAKTEIGYEKQRRTVLLFDGDIYPSEDLKGTVTLSDGKEMNITSFFKGYNPDNTVNYTKIEAI